VSKHLKTKLLAGTSSPHDERDATIFQHASIAIATTDWEGRFEQCNPAYCDLLGYSMQELLAVNFAALVHPDDRAVNMRELERLKSGELGN
jgi:PAS domain S-box-containing protein